MSKEHIDEIPTLINKHGVTSFKIFMFYGSHGLHGRSSDQSKFLMTPEGERYDIAHFEFVMRGIQKARQQFPDKAEAISLSLHCETAEIMAAYTKLVEEESQLTGLKAYSASCPRTRRAWRSRSRPTSPTKPACRESTCCTSARPRPSRPRC